MCLPDNNDQLSCPTVCRIQFPITYGTHFQLPELIFEMPRLSFFFYSEGCCGKIICSTQDPCNARTRQQGASNSVFLGCKLRPHFTNTVFDASVHIFESCFAQVIFVLEYKFCQGHCNLNVFEILQHHCNENKKLFFPPHHGLAANDGWFATRVTDLPSFMEYSVHT